MTAFAPAGGSGDLDLDVEGRSIRLTNLDKLLWPAVGLRKDALVDYYLRVAGVLLPHVRGRPVALHRFPDGVAGNHWYDIRCPRRPPWVRTQRMHTFFERTGKEVDACVIDDVATLVWAAQMAAIELHPYLGCVDDLAHPTAVVFDFDPSAPAGFLDACRVALAARKVLDGLGLRSVVKTSGGRGIHVYVPVAAGHTYGATKAFAKAVAGLLVRADRARVVDRRARSGHGGKVLVDVGQNDHGKSMVAPYSLRGFELPTVSTPATWDEVESVVARGDPGALFFGPGDVLERIASHGDLFAGAAVADQALPEAVWR